MWLKERNASCVYAHRERKTDEVADATSITAVLGPPTQKEGRKKPEESPGDWLFGAGVAVKIVRKSGGTFLTLGALQHA